MPPKRRRKFHGLYFHSSPPKVLTMNGSSNTTGSSSKHNGRDNGHSREAFVVKPSSIRIWIHDKDVAKLTRVLWAGQGNRLRTEVSTHPKVRKFLENVPYVLNVIKDVHQAVVDNNMEALQTKIEPPVPPSLITTKDVNGLTVMHKAAGLAHTRIVEYLVKIWPDGATDIDLTGKTPLHWAASAKNNTRCYNLLVQAGAYEEALDYKMKTAAHYKQKSNDLDRSFLTVIPDAPRVPLDHQPDWYALVDDIGRLSREEPNNNYGLGLGKGRRGSDVLGNGMNLLTTRSKANSIEDTSEPDDIDEGNGQISIEEQAVLAAIDDEKLYKNQEKLERGKLAMDKALGQDIKNGNDVDPEFESTQPPNDSEPISENLESKSDHILSANTEGRDQPEPETDQLNNNQNDVGGSEDASDKEENTENDENAENDENDDNNEGDKIDKEGEEQVESNDENEDVVEKDDNEKEDEVKSVENVETENVSEEGGKDEEGEKSEEVIDVEDENKEKLQDDSNDEPNDEEDKKDENVTEDVEETNSDIVLAKSEKIEESKTEIEKNEAEPESEDHETEEKTELDDPETNEDADIVDDDDITKIEDPKDEEIDKEIDAGDEEAAEDKYIDDAVKTALNTNNDVELNKNLSNTNLENKSNDTDKNNTDTKTGNEDDAGDGEDEEVKINPLMTTPEKNRIDENHNSIPNKDQQSKGENSPSPPMEIQGLVRGEPDNNQVQSQSGGYVANEESRVQSVIESGDMEQLAALVLNGEGNKLMGKTSKQPEIQAFLDNVTAYMNKIRRVHVASKEGNIRDLQAALDRRKFAIAKDEVSPNGASPLHVATIFGHAAIIRYLAGRFPETTSAVDDEGRTALHYAAAIKDNGHFYNLLVHLGSNPKATDKLGNTPEVYSDHEKSKPLLTHRQLLKRFGVDENLEEEMLSDQVPDDVHSARRLLDDVDIMATLERCFRLIHEPHHSADPLAADVPSSASSLRVSIITYLAKFLKKSVFEKIKHRQTRLDHNLFDVIWPAMKKSNKERRIDEDLNSGVVAPDFDVFVVFQEFLVPLIKDMHCMNVNQEFKPHPRIFYFPPVDGKPDTDVSVDLDISGKYITDGFVECSRNLDDFELPLNLNIGQMEQAERLLIEKILSSEFAMAIGEDEVGTYYTMNEVLENPSEIRTILAASKLLIPLLDSSDTHQEAESLAINGQYWPYGRGVFISCYGDLVAWINAQEHLRIMVCTPGDTPADIGYAYSKVGQAIVYLETRLHFRESYLLGFLASRPSFLGTSLKLSLTLELPNLFKEIDNLRHLCTVRGLNMITNVTNGTIRVVNMQSLGITEWRIFQDYCSAVANILQLEKDMSLTNSKHIAAMLVKIFRRKKNSVVDP